MTDFRTTRNIWVTSDTHFSHEYILQKRTQFSNVDQMNECIIDHWNDHFKQGDILWHLGDVFFGNRKWFEDAFSKATSNMRVNLILGNHDDGKYMAKTGFFRKIVSMRSDRKSGFCMSHMPLHIESLYHWHRDEAPMVNIHGHTHDRDDWGDPYICVCVEKTDYKPVNIEDLLALAGKTRERWTPSDGKADLDRKVEYGTGNRI